ncbi:50S ribosomal protein L3 [Desulfonema ishimotonii]|uniref:Large ribosomal subunit protein uL3 n=1 Tax=Desulfonema ishimotonii TaxID=45657 RepID=A0A401G0D6_9BACT|nr:50S ribosomal protein L3 [Desulfonema ishimotonii]GBC62667.1 50S ribosomal protein L3 [Desulfonema ishimotonii]
MCKGLIGKKLGMTAVFAPDGKQIPVTVVQVGPCVVTQIKTTATDGYNALQLGFGEKKASRINKPVKGHLEKSGASLGLLKEVAVDDPEAYSVGQAISTDIFVAGERVDVTGTTKGRGFSGVMKRHGFGGGRKTHGSKSHRIPGSIGCSAWPSRVIRGKKMPGHYGDSKKTIKNLEIVDVRPDENLILLRGAVPGATSGVLTIKKR